VKAASALTQDEQENQDMLEDPSDCRLIAGSPAPCSCTGCCKVGELLTLPKLRHWRQGGGRCEAASSTLTSVTASSPPLSQRCQHVADGCNDAALDIYLPHHIDSSRSLDDTHHDHTSHESRHRRHVSERQQGCLAAYTGRGLRCLAAWGAGVLYQPEESHTAARDPTPLSW
jgi:hypothetical protein